MGIANYFIGLGMVLFVWPIFIAEQLASYGELAISSMNLTGMNAIIWGNLNLLLFLIIIIVTLIVVRFGGE